MWDCSWSRVQMFRPPAPAGRAGRMQRSSRAERDRETVVCGLRAVARAATQSPPRRFSAVLRVRAGAVHRELLELAAALERCREPDLATVRALRRLLSDGVTSPLYNPAVSNDELGLTLSAARLALAEHVSPQRSAASSGRDHHTPTLTQE